MSTTTCWCKKTGQQFLVTCTRRQAPTVHKDSPKSCKWAAKSMGSACPSLGTDTGFGLLSPRDFLTSSAFFRQHYKELQMGIEKNQHYYRINITYNLKFFTSFSSSLRLFHAMPTFLLISVNSE